MGKLDWTPRNMIHTFSGTHVMHNWFTLISKKNLHSDAKFLRTSLWRIVALQGQLNPQETQPFSVGQGLVFLNVIVTLAAA